MRIIQINAEVDERLHRKICQIKGKMTWRGFFERMAEKKEQVKEALK